jgi:hypothetical protein
MPEPDEIRFACIGCGAMNPVGAEVCAGCGHRFAGPAGGRISPTSTGPAPAIEEPIVSFSPSRPNHDLAMMLGCLANVIGIMIAVVATFVAGVVAFFVTCTSLDAGDTPLLWSSLAGLGAASAVVAFSVWVGSVLRSGRNRIDPRPDRGKDR